MTTLMQTVAALVAGNVTAVQLVHLALDKADKSQHVFIELFVDQAMTDARASDARRSEGSTLGPLDGIPLAIKDLFDVKGSRTRAGSITRDGVMPAAEDAPIVALLRAQGMILLGKTNLSEFAFSGLGLNPHFGTPVPDFAGVDPRVPGGSSSGSAVAVQRGIVCAALGSDTGGSIRVPAAFNGLTGFKGSPQRYDKRHVHPLAHSLDSLGPLAHSVVDCVLLDAAMRGLPSPVIEAADISTLRFVVDQNVLDDAQLQTAVRDNLMQIMNRLQTLGATVSIRPVETVQSVRELIAREGWLGAVEAWELLAEVMRGPRAHLIDRRVSARLIAASHISDRRAQNMREARGDMLKAIVNELDGALLVLPTVNHVTPALAALEQDDELFARTNIATLSLTMIGSFLNMPGIAMPSGFDSQGLPTSILFSLPQGFDDQVLSTALAVEHAVTHDL